MTKIEINSGGSPFPKSIVLVGSMVDGRPKHYRFKLLKYQFGTGTVCL